MGFMDLEKACDKVNREALWQVLRMYDVDGILLSGIKSMYVDSLAGLRVKGNENETGLYHVHLAFQFINECSDYRGENWYGEEERELRLCSLLHVDDLVLCGEPEKEI